MHKRRRHDGVLDFVLVLVLVGAGVLGVCALVFHGFYLLYDRTVYR